MIRRSAVATVAALSLLSLSPLPLHSFALWKTAALQTPGTIINAPAYNAIANGEYAVSVTTTASAAKVIVAIRAADGSPVCDCALNGGPTNWSGAVHLSNVVNGTYVIKATPDDDSTRSAENTFTIANAGQSTGGGTVGPPGPPGPPGPAGPTGPAGPAGPQGPQGAKGDVGAQGPQGIQGKDGAPGPTGAQGPQGQPGIQGVVGPPGATGPAGSIGPTGSQGPQGAVGPPGSTGPAGVAGPQGPAGPMGPAGASGGAIFELNSNGVLSKSDALVGATVGARVSMAITLVSQKSPGSPQQTATLVSGCETSSPHELSPPIPLPVGVPVTLVKTSYPGQSMCVRLGVQNVAVTFSMAYSIIGGF